MNRHRHIQNHRHIEGEFKIQKTTQPKTNYRIQFKVSDPSTHSVPFRFQTVKQFKKIIFKMSQLGVSSLANQHILVRNAIKKLFTKKFQVFDIFSAIFSTFKITPKLSSPTKKDISTPKTHSRWLKISGNAFLYQKNKL